MKENCKNLSCGCKEQNQDLVKNSEEEKKISSTEKAAKNSEEKSRNNLDPTHFGDWQVNCRAIDF